MSFGVWGKQARLSEGQARFPRCKVEGLARVLYVIEIKKGHVQEAQILDQTLHLHPNNA